MLGAITGDIIGSGYEAYEGIPDRDFDLFKDPEDALTFLDVSQMTDDSILTFAVADYMLQDDLEGYEALRKWYEKYPDQRFGNWFKNWAKSDQKDGYNSYGNGSAMRISPVPYFFEKKYECYNEARNITEVTHDHPEGIRCALATVHAMWLGMEGEDKDKIKSEIEDMGYNLDFDYQNLQSEDAVKPICQITVPRAVYCFLISEDFESAIRNAICIGGDTDTTAAITGSISEVFYGGVPEDILNKTLTYFDEDQYDILVQFLNETGNTYGYSV